MAGWSYEQDFEGLSTGDLVGQDSWTAGGPSDYPQVTGANASEGSQSIVMPVDVNSQARRNITAANDDGTTMYFSAYTSDASATENMVVFLWSGSTRIGDIYINAETAGDWSFRNALGSWNSQGTLSSSTWYRIGIEFDFTNNRVRLNIDDGTWGSWISLDNSVSSVDRIWVGGNGGSGTPSNYIDNISASYSSGGGGASPRMNALGFGGM